MRDLDNFISPVPGFDSDIPIPAILVSARDPNAESSEEPPVGSNTSTPKDLGLQVKGPCRPKSP
jgi:hypothetical protein